MYCLLGVQQAIVRLWQIGGATVAQTLTMYERQDDWYTVKVHLILCIYHFMSTIAFNGQLMVKSLRVEGKHVGSIQDLPELLLHTKTGKIMKGRPMFNCSLGTKSLEFYHLHLVDMHMFTAI